MESSSENDERVAALLARLRELPPSERDARLRVECAGDEALLNEVLETVDWEERMGPFLLDPAFSVTDNFVLSPPGDVITRRCEASAAVESSRKRLWIMAAALAITAGALALAVRKPLVNLIRPPAVRLVMLSTQTANDLTPLAGGILEDLTSRIRPITVAGGIVVVIPPDETLRAGVRSAGEAGRMLHATHVLEASMRHDGDTYALHGELVELGTGARLGETSATYPQSALTAIPTALAAIISSALHLKTPAAIESLAAPAAEYYFRGLYFLHRDWRSFDEAIPLFEAAVRNDTRSPQPWIGLAEAQIMKSQATHDPHWLVMAGNSLQAARRSGLNTVPMRLAAAALGRSAGSYEEALNNYRRVLELEPCNQEALRGVAFTYEAMRFQAQAVESYRKAIKCQPGYYAPYQDLGLSYYRRGKYPESEEQFRNAITAAPGLTQLYTNLATVLVSATRYREAESLLRESLRRGETAAAFNTLGATLAFQGRDAEAVGFYRKALAIDDRNYLSLVNLADACRRLGRSAEANEAYRNAAVLARGALGESARTGYERAIAGYCAARLGDRQTAEGEIEQALKVSPSDSATLTHAVLAYQALGDTDRALEILAQAPPEVVRQLARLPDSTALRRHPRFQQMMARAGH